MARLDFRNHRLLAGGAVAALIAAVVVLSGALDAGREAQRLFDSMDVNRDGFISREEAWADSRVERRFSLGDRNQDGKLDRAEFYELLDSERR